MIETKNIARSFGKTPAVQNLNLQVKRGSIYGFLGRNGAGKTSTIKMLVGLIWPDQGEIQVNGCKPADFQVEDRQKIGYLAEKQILPAGMRAGKLIEFCSKFYPKWDFELSDRILKRFHIDPVQRIKNLSQGGARQVGLLLALAPKPDLLILDEPAGGLDVVARREFLDEILELIQEDGKTVFFSSHILSDVERVADEIGIIKQGTLVLSEALDRLKDTVKQVRFFGFSNPTGQFDIPNAFRLKRGKDEVMATLRIENENTLQQLAAAHRCQYEIRALNLEDIFVEITRDF